MYANDSFFDLTPLGQIGLAALSFTLFGLTLGLAWFAMRRRGLPVRILLAVVFFVGFLWLAPQIYYTYYIALIEDLPWQIVIKYPPGPATLFDLLRFGARPSMADHSRGLLGWVLLIMAVLPYIRGRRTH